jgi:ArsR family transcriptional regulator
MRALGDPVRLRILELLPIGEQAGESPNVSELARGLEISQPTLSHHLGILRNAGLVRFKKRQRDVYYWTDSEILDSTIRGLERILRKE